MIEEGATRAPPEESSLRERVSLSHAALAGVLALSAVLNIRKLSQNGYSNIYYSAGVRSMLHSFHNFLFASFDPGGLISIDKPPLGLWVQVASAKLFGFSPLSLLLPEAILGVLTVAALYWVMAPCFGRVAAMAGALGLAVFPSFVAISRDNGIDALLILLMILACGAALRAIENGRLRTLLGCAVLLGLAFNTKALAAYLIVPGIALAHLVCAPGSVRRRLAQLLAAGAALVAVSCSWLALVEVTPASQRPFVGGSTNNTEFGLTFGYNGFGRVNGQVGGPGRIPVNRAALALLGGGGPSRGHRAAGAPAPARGHLSPTLPNGRARFSTAFAGPTGPLRLLGAPLGDQGGWMLPFAFVGLVALGLVTLGRGRRRRDPRLAGLLVLGGWFLTEGIILSTSKGIVHPYYISALGPGVAAMTGAGAVALSKPTRRWDWHMALTVCAVAGTVAAQVVLLHRAHYMRWFEQVLLVGAAVGVGGLLALRRLRGPAMAFTLCLLLIAPTAYAATTWLAPVQGTFPAAGPRQAIGDGGFGVGPVSLQVDRALVGYVRAHGPGGRWAVLTEASNTAAPLILLGLDAGALGGYGGTDPALDGRGLARLVARGEARYVVIGGPYANRGGNRATGAALRACRLVPASVWQGTALPRGGLLLYDCAGRERRLAS